MSDDKILCRKCGTNTFEDHDNYCRTCAPPRRVAVGYNEKSGEKIGDVLRDLHRGLRKDLEKTMRFQGVTREELHQRLYPKRPNARHSRFDDLFREDPEVPGDVGMFARAHRAMGSNINSGLFFRKSRT